MHKVKKVKIAAFLFGLFGVLLFVGAHSVNSLRYMIAGTFVIVVSSMVLFKDPGLRKLLALFGLFFSALTIAAVVPTLI